MSAEGETFDFVVVSNRLPVDRVVSETGGETWRVSPGGLVAALEPMMRASDGAWIGWTGVADDHLDPFENDGITLVPVSLSAEDIEEYYEGFSNDTLWPLYHDVISAPRYHRDWWEAYVRVNQRFAERTVNVAAAGATVWVHDYQLQLVPRLLREARPDLTIGFFNHIPFPAYGIYAQLPWRTQIIEGLLGADVIGFQRAADASNFTRAARRLLGVQTKGSLIEVPLTDRELPPESVRAKTSRRGTPVRTVVAKQFPISIDADSFVALASRPEIQARAVEIRSDLGDPRVIILGVDRLDYTKGIRHRLKAYGDLLEDNLIEPGDVLLVQVASPSRERVSAYRELRDEVELTVGRLNGDFSTFSTR